jgi:hypothetical protein
MHLSVGVHALALAEGEVLVLDAAAGVGVQVRHGCAWITREGDREDVVLTPRQSEWRAPGAGRLIVQAMGGPLRLTVRRLPQPQPVLHWLRGLQGAIGLRAVAPRLPEAW